MIKLLTLEDKRRQTLSYFLRPIVQEVLGYNWRTDQDFFTWAAIVQEKRKWNNWFPNGFIRLSRIEEDNEVEIKIFVSTSNMTNALKLADALEKKGQTVLIEECN